MKLPSEEMVRVKLQPATPLSALSKRGGESLVTRLSAAEEGTQSLSSPLSNFLPCIPNWILDLKENFPALVRILVLIAMIYHFWVNHLFKIETIFEMVRR